MLTLVNIAISKLELDAYWGILGEVALSQSEQSVLSVFLILATCSSQIAKKILQPTCYSLWQSKAGGMGASSTRDCLGMVGDVVLHYLLLFSLLLLCFCSSGAQYVYIQYDT